MAGEALPDVTSTNKAIRYLQAQAALGRFTGHSTSLLVMYYLVTYMWVSRSPDGQQGQFEVMRGKSGIDDIMAGTALSRSPVKRAIRWLADEEWIDTQRQVDDTGRETNRYIYLKLDTAGHRERERRRASKPAPLRLVDHNREGVPKNHTRVS